MYSTDASVGYVLSSPVSLATSSAEVNEKEQGMFIDYV